MIDGGRLVAALEARIARYGSAPALVAFSGGVDSSVVVAVAARALGPSRVLAATAVSAAVPEREVREAAATAAAIGVEHRVVETRELGLEAYTRNDESRCFHCKVELYSALRRLHATAARDGRLLLTGTNADDLADVRPGIRAGLLLEARSPLVDEGMGKAAVRTMAHALGLPNAAKPAAACLSSRVAHGIRITPALLGRIEAAEEEMRALGFSDVRVRHFGDVAKVEVPLDEVPLLLEASRRASVVAILRARGWRHLTVDLEGLRSGSMNVMADDEPVPADGAAPLPAPEPGVPRQA
jgi:pyridinium-3,5-biscarboxylic acid mononucleotide sulfurtransferase